MIRWQDNVTVYIDENMDILQKKTNFSCFKTNWANDLYENHLDMMESEGTFCVTRRKVDIDMMNKLKLL